MLSAFSDFGGVCVTIRRVGMMALLGAAAGLAFAAPAAAQTRTRPVDVIAKPAPDTDPKNKIGLDYEYETFNNTFTDWHWLSLEYSHRFEPVTMIGRVNWAHRFDDDAMQYEVDAYPKLWKGAYLYLNYGVAESDTFLPERRYGAELFWGFGKAMEASVGMRRLEFDPRYVNLYTGSFGWYRGDWFFVLRPWISNKPGETTVSGSVMARRYFATRDDHCTLRVGGGEGSDFDQSIDELLLSNQWNVTAEWQRRFRPLWIAKAKAGFRNVTYETGTERESWVIGGGISRLF
jgi:YaiO family outer membrane protein